MLSFEGIKAAAQNYATRFLAKGDSTLETSGTKSKKRGFPLLDLPPELRNMVYFYWLTMFGNDGARRVLSIEQFMIRYQSLPSVLLGNKQLISEAQPVFAGTNIVQLRGREFREQEKTTHRNQHYLNYLCKHHQNPVTTLNDEYNCQLELPPSRIRPFLKRIKIVLYAPTESMLRHEAFMGRLIKQGEKVWEAEDIDWLYPLREIRSLGFTRLLFLAIDIIHPRYGTSERRIEFREWTQEKIEGLVEAGQLVVTFQQRWDLD